MIRKIAFVAAAAIISAIGYSQIAVSDDAQKSETMTKETMTKEEMKDGLATAIFAGGCFWCVEKDFEHVKGVDHAVSGYTGGDLENPTYRNHGQHVEAVKVFYDPKQVDYKQLVEVFWRSVDPTDAGGQFCDRGHSYTTAIFADGDDQMKVALQSKEMLMAANTLKAPIVTPVLPAKFFTDAEDYHQDYYKKNPLRYKGYRFGCGRDARINSLWGDEAHKGIEGY